METLTIKAPAKVNLWLEVKSKRPDGYHDIESVMQTVTLFDQITVTRKCDGGIALTCSSDALPCDESNLCHKSARLFSRRLGADIHASIHIEKRIPMSAGLGGGSSDAAAVLILLNRLYGEPFDADTLCEMGRSLGADVPFCIKKGILVTKGIGEVFEACPRLPDCFMVIACSGEGVSTPWAYRRLDEMYDLASRHIDVDGFTVDIASGDIGRICGGMTNIFESAVLPERHVPVKIKGIMDECGTLRSMMSGSGPSVIGIFSDEASARSACERLQGEGIFAEICKPYYPDGE